MIPWLSLLLTAACADKNIEVMWIPDTGGEGHATDDSAEVPEWVDLACEISSNGVRCLCDASGFGTVPRPIDAWLYRPTAYDPWTRPAYMSFDAASMIYNLESESGEYPIAECVVSLYVD